MNLVIRSLVKVYELETTALDGDKLCFRLEVFSDGAVFTARLQRHEFFRIQPTFPQKDGEPNPALACDEQVLVRDTELGGAVEALREESEGALLRKVAGFFAAAFPGVGEPTDEAAE